VLRRSQASCTASSGSSSEPSIRGARVAGRAVRAEPAAPAGRGLSDRVPVRQRTRGCGAPVQTASRAASATVAHAMLTPREW
jgi:hypothetical protein